MGFGEAAEPTKLVVSELHTHISGSDLKEVFAPFGAVVGIEVQTANGQPDGPSIGVAVVTFEEAAHAKDAQAAINDCYLLGPIVVHPEAVGWLGENYIRVHDLQALRAQ